MIRPSLAVLPFGACVVAFLVTVAALPARSDDGPTAPAKAAAFELPPGVKFAPGILVRKDLEYGTGSGRALRLDLYSPEKAPVKSARGLPFVLWIHGGGWVAGDRKPCGTISLVAKGFVTASVEYRFSAEAVFPAQIEDCKAAIRWVRAHAEVLGVDPERIGAAGASAGGHLAALLGVAGDAVDLEGAGGCPGSSSAVHAVCNIFGPTDLLKFDGHGSIIVAENDTSVIAQLLGGSISTRRELATKASPISYVTKDDPPFLIVHGDKDNIVPVDQSKSFDAALSKAGVDSTLIVVKGMGHAALPADVNAKITEFFETRLKPRKAKPAAPAMPAPVPVPPAMTDGR